MLRKIRITFAALFLAITTLLFLDFTGTIHSWLGFMAKIQFFPALLAMNLVVVAALVLLTLIFGRVYCSVICPLGVFQDVVSRFNKKKNRYRYSSDLTFLRYGVLGVFAVMFFAGVGSVVALLEPYSIYGRVSFYLFSPVYQLGNNILSYFAQRVDSYLFWDKEIWIRSIGVLITTILTFVAIIVLAWRNGRTYCNSICPVGTLLGFLSRYSIYKHRIDTTKCNGCGLCASNCKSSCIDHATHTIDYSRCVSCFNCIDKCNKKAISYTYCRSKTDNKSNDHTDSSRRKLLTTVGALVVTTVVEAQEKKVDGGLAFIEDKKIPKRLAPIVPPGAISSRNFFKNCTGCQLCVSVCQNNVLRPSSSLETFMQPELSYERGYCRPECVKCSEVCPAGAINKIDIADKTAIQIGHAVWIEKNCVTLTDGVSCGNCAKHCPSGAIEMVAKDLTALDSPKIPIVNIERCIGCGACENLCPARPFSAIYVEGHNMHRTI